MAHPQWYLNLVYAHLATILPALLIGGFLLAKPKGTPAHRAWGKLYMSLMGVTAIVVLLMPAQVGPQILGHFGFIHLLAGLTLYSLHGAIVGVRAGNIARHKGNMKSLYLFGILIAGFFALMPGRILHGWLFGWL